MNILELGALLLAGVFFIIIYYMDKVKKFDFSNDIRIGFWNYCRGCI